MCIQSLHRNPSSMLTMIRSEYTANVLLSTPRAPVASWMRPAPVRAVRTVQCGLFARLFNLTK